MASSNVVFREVELELTPNAYTDEGSDIRTLMKKHDPVGNYQRCTMEHGWYLDPENHRIMCKAKMDEEMTEPVTFMRVYRSRMHNYGGSNSDIIIIKRENQPPSFVNSHISAFIGEGRFKNLPEARKCILGQAKQLNYTQIFVPYTTAEFKGKIIYHWSDVYEIKPCNKQTPLSSKDVRLISPIEYRVLDEYKLTPRESEKNQAIVALYHMQYPPPRFPITLNSCFNIMQAMAKSETTMTDSDGQWDYTFTVTKKRRVDE